MIETYVCPACQQNIEWDDSSCEEFIECHHCGDKLRAPNAPMFKKGTVIGDYVIKKRLGVGGMGEVFLAEQQSMMRPVALKVLQQDLVEDKSYLERFSREVRTLAQIEHPNIVNVIETGWQDNICYFSMSYVNGHDIKYKLDTEGKLTEIDALHVILNVAGALKYVWETHKLIHRDIKPANIILTDDNEVKLMDLGISKTMADDRPADLTMAGMMVGSPYYVSPEQARAEQDIDWRADMYSLGASFYHMLVGCLPFDSENVMAIIAAHLSEPRPDPRDKNPDVSDRSANIVGQMMQKEREKRFASWDDAIEAIETAIDEISGKGASTAILTFSPEDARKKVKSSRAVKKTVTKHVASPDIVEKVRLIVAKSIFGNLYIRFITLVFVLFLTFLAFFYVVKESINDAKTKEAKIRFETAISFIKNKPNTTSTRKRAIRLLMAVKTTKDPKYSDLAQVEIDKLRHSHLEEQTMWTNDILRDELRKLKDKSYNLEQKGKIEDALKIWRTYAIEGGYATELKDEIKKAVKYLKREKKRRGAIGI